MLMLQPVFPSGLTWFVHKIKIFANQTLRIADLPTLQKLGVDISHYSSRDYGRTQEIADAAYFLGFDGLIAPSARWACLNAVLFIDRILPEHIAITQSAAEPVLFDEWRKRHRKS